MRGSEWIRSMHQIMYEHCKGNHVAYDCVVMHGTVCDVLCLCVCVYIYIDRLGRRSELRGCEGGVVVERNLLIG